VDARRSEAAWTDPDRTTGVERGLSGAAIELARSLEADSGSRHVDWTVASLRRQFRDEDARQQAYEASRAAAEEAARLEEEEGVVVPVVRVEPHPLHRGVAAAIADENRTVRALARERAARRVYTLDVRAVWLSGDLPAEAPLPWRGTAAGAGVEPVGGQLRAGAPQSAEVAVARRGLAGRRDETALRAGHH